MWRGAGGGGQGQEGGAGAQAVGAGLRHLPSGTDHPHQYCKDRLLRAHNLARFFWPFTAEVKLKSSKIKYTCIIRTVGKCHHLLLGIISFYLQPKYP